MRKKDKFVRPTINKEVYEIVETYLLQKINIIFITDDIDLNINKNLIVKLCNKYYNNMSNFKIKLYLNSKTRVDISHILDSYDDFDNAIATAIICEFENDHCYDPCSAINSEIQLKMDKLFDAGRFDDMLDLSRKEYCKTLGIKYKILDNIRYIYKINY